MSTAFVSSTAVTSATSGILAHGPVTYRYFRARVTAYTSGTVQGTLELFTAPAAMQSLGVGAVQSGTWSVSSAPVAAVTVGTSTYKNLSVLNVDNSIKASAGNVYSLTAYNAAASIRYLKFYNAATVTVGTTVPVSTIPLPPGLTTAFNAGAVGMYFNTQVHCAATTGFADTDTGAPTANDVILNLVYA